MRKALFAVVLVSASFAGGAVVNGPGLRWARAMVLDRMGMGDGEGSGAGDIASVPTAPAPPEEIPARPIPPLLAEPTTTTTTATATPKPEAGPSTADAVAVAVADKNAAGREPRRPAAKVSAETAATAPAPVSALAASATVMPGLAPVPEESLPPEVPAPVSTPRGRETAAATEPSVRKPAEARDPAVRRASLSGESTSAAEPAAVAESGDWGAIRDALKAFGVSRYGVEGEPAGRSRFYCVIPVAGRRAVGQHFEAEGDDAVQAARAALKRVALWKAAERGGNTP